MDLPLVVVIAVLAFGAGAGLGLWLRRPTGRMRAREQVPGTDRPATPQTLQALDAMAAQSLRRLASWVRPDRGEEPALTLAEDGTITLLFGDIARSTALNVRLGDDAFAGLLRTHDRTVRRLVGAHDGRVVKTQGDGFLAVFHDPHDAIALGLDLCEEAADGQDTGESLALRVGIHTGRAVTEKGDVFGESVSFAARVAATARGGQVLVSDAVRDRVEPVVADLDFSSRLLPSKLKGIPGLHRLWRVERDD